MLDLVEKYSKFDDQQPQGGTEGQGSEHRDEVVVRIIPNRISMEAPFSGRKGRG